jgi:hypothetical protein
VPRWRWRGGSETLVDTHAPSATSTRSAGNGHLGGAVFAVDDDDDDDDDGAGHDVGP